MATIMENPFLHFLDPEFIHQISHGNGTIVFGHFHVCLTIAVWYLILIWIGGRWMRHRTPFRLRGPLILWNLVLATFSITGVIKTWPELYHLLRDTGLRGTICTPACNTGVTCFWTVLFVFSKVLELGDTMFITLRKQPLIFLHYYHHAIVLLFTWYAGMTSFGPGRWFIALNYGVHSLMYSYYALRAYGVRLPRVLAMIITILQIVQMFVGMFITGYAFTLQQEGDQCSTHTLTYAMIMYFSYLILFIKFFVDSYFLGSKTKNMEINGKNGKNGIIDKNQNVLKVKSN
jgi:hypothetical protein